MPEEQNEVVTITPETTTYDKIEILIRCLELSSYNPIIGDQKVWDDINEMIIKQKIMNLIDKL